MPLLFRMYPGGLTMMTAYQFGFQWTRDPWTKIDYSTVPIAGIKNIDEYGTVSITGECCDSTLISDYVSMERRASHQQLDATTVNRSTRDVYNSPDRRSLPNTISPQ